MNENYNGKPVCCFIVSCCLILLLASGISAGEIKIIKDPKPTHVEKKFVKLKKVKEINEEIDDEHFFARPSHLVPAKDGSLFVSDKGLNKIIKLDKDLKFVNKFVNRGKGPGEITGMMGIALRMSISRNGLLYLSSPINKKVIEFSTDGKFIRDIRFPDNFRKKFYQPVVDESGNIYVHSYSGGAVDIFDAKGKFLKTLLTEDDYKTFVVMIPRKEFIHSQTKNDLSNTFYDTLPDNGFIIYLTQSSTVYIFKNQKLVRKFRFWPLELFKKYKKIVEDDPIVKNSNTTIPFCFSFFVDKDFENCFYIESLLGSRSLYKINLQGELISVLTTENEYGNFEAKKNKKFYGMNKRDGRIFVYKEES